MLDPHIEEQFDSGRLIACVSSPPGHRGRADGLFHFRPIHLGERAGILHEEDTVEEGQASGGAGAA
ncbi:hypothetical protein AB3S75_006728 [Citrus x aurantiifolia]